MTNLGKITYWNDDKGYGFIDPDSGGDRVFVHVKAFNNRSRRPAAGCVVSYNMSADSRRGVRAVRVTYLDREETSGLTMGWGFFSMVGATLFLSCVCAFGFSDTMSPVIPCVYLGASMITYFAYAKDKSAAKDGSWRTQEKTLHLFSLMGGWPGAILAQQKFRHKTKKVSFRSVFWVTVILNCGGFAWFLMPNSVEKTVGFIDALLVSIQFSLRQIAF